MSQLLSPFPVVAALGGDPLLWGLSWCSRSRRVPWERFSSLCAKQGRAVANA